MRYLLLIRGDESAAAHADEGCFGWSERMLERGVRPGGGGLRPPRPGGGLRPPAEGRAAQHPAASYGTVEVRELWPPL